MFHRCRLFTHFHIFSQISRRIFTGFHGFLNYDDVWKSRRHKFFTDWNHRLITDSFNIQNRNFSFDFERLTGSHVLLVEFAGVSSSHHSRNFSFDFERLTGSHVLLVEFAGVSSSHHSRGCDRRVSDQRCSLDHAAAEDGLSLSHFKPLRTKQKFACQICRRLGLYQASGV